MAAPNSTLVPIGPSTPSSPNRPKPMVSAPPPTTKFRLHLGSFHHPLPARLASAIEKLSSNPLPQVLPRNRYTEKGAFRYLVCLAVSSTSSVLSTLPPVTE